MAKSLCNDLRLLYNQLRAVQDVNLYSYMTYDMRPFEFRYLKYKLVYTIINLMQLNICKSFENYRLPDVEELLELWGEEEEISDWYDVAYECMYTFDNISQLLLEEALANTSWEIDIVTDMEDYEFIPEETIQLFKEEISIHWGAWNDNSNKIYESKFLSSLGCEPISDVCMWPSCTVFITNSKVNQLLKMAKVSPFIKEENEYEEIISILDQFLFYRYYPFSSRFYSTETEQYCECYVFGEIYDTSEFLNFYHLDYAQVVGFLLVDILTNKLLNKYDKGEKEHSIGGTAISQHI